MRVGLRGAIVGIAVLSVATVSAGCAYGGDPVPPPVPPSNGLAAPMRAEAASTFFAPTAIEGAVIVAPPADLRDGVDRSTAVVVAEVDSVRPTRVIVGETGADRVEMAGAVLQVDEVLHGQLRPELDEVVVEFLAPVGIDDTVATMAANLPRGSGRLVPALEG